jgi:hypothetical protein
MRAFDALEMSRILAQTLPLHDDRNEPPAKPAARAAKKTATKRA